MRSFNPYSIIYWVSGTILLVMSIAGGAYFIWYLSGDTIGIRLNRIGMGLELLGIMSVIPELIGEKSISNLDSKFKNSLSDIKSVLSKVSHFFSNFPFSLLEEYPFFWQRGIVGRILLVGNLFGSALLVTDLFWLKTFAMEVDTNSKIFFYSLETAALLWLILGAVLILTIKISQQIEKPSIFFMIIVTLFFISHVFITISSLPFSFAISILLIVGLRLSLYLFHFSFRQVTAWITLPLVLFGNILQLLATFIK